MARRGVVDLHGLEWTVEDGINWVPPVRTEDEFQIDLDTGREGVVMVLTALFCLGTFVVVWPFQDGSGVIVPPSVALLAMCLVGYFPFRWYARRPRSVSVLLRSSPDSRLTRSWIAHVPSARAQGDAVRRAIATLLVRDDPHTALAGLYDFEGVPLDTLVQEKAIIDRADQMPSETEVLEIGYAQLVAAVRSGEVAGQVPGEEARSDLVRLVSQRCGRWAALVQSELRAVHNSRERLDDAFTSTFFRLAATAAFGPGSGLPWWRRAFRRVPPIHTLPDTVVTAARNVAATDRAIIELRSSNEDALVRLGDSIRERCVLPELRTQLSILLGEDAVSTVLSSGDGRGLDQLLPPDFELNSAAFERVTGMIDQFSTAAIGLAGPRGCGKTTLLTAVCKAPGADGPPTLPLLISAPVAYDTREFLLHLASTFGRAVIGLSGSDGPRGHPRGGDDSWTRRYIGRLIGRAAGILAASTLVVYCLALLGNTAGGPAPGATVSPTLAPYAPTILAVGTFAVVFGALRRAVTTPLRELYAFKRPGQEVPFRRLDAAARLFSFLGAIAFVAALAGPALAILHDLGPQLGAPAVPTWLRPLDVRLALGAMGIALGVAGLAVIVPASKREGWAFASSAEDIDRSLAIGSDLPDLPARAQELLDAIGFQMAWSRSNASRFGVNLGTYLPLSHDVTDTSSETRTAQPWTRPEIVRMFRELLEEVGQTYRIVIAVDELDKVSAERAVDFVEDLKAIFGVPNCFYLVSISEDAMEDFERRGTPFRTAFDSAFDEVVALRYFTFDESRELLRSRVVAMPQRFSALCHVVSGGLPRDLLRAARSLYGLGVPITLEAAARRMVLAELSRRTISTAKALRTVPVTNEELARVLRWADSDEGHDLGDDALLRDIAEVRGAAKALRDSADHTVAEQFSSWSTFALFALTLIQLCDESRRDHAGILEFITRLAQARQAFTVHPDVAMDRVETVRAEVGLF
ncbi:hypothetical protein GCM10009836_46530 [Pseudonocardia ailaonensis]|uniref:KAP NTPase domain-containing protein n=1 Tax=Pseudonocardia ailaonensis TaxID=367279 RepID=A0ABN2NE55_9PSEU